MTTRKDAAGDGHEQKGAVSPLRRRMIQDMEMAGLCKGTQQTYTRAVAALQSHFRKRPDQLTEAEVHKYILWLREEKKVAKGTFQTFQDMANRFTQLVDQLRGVSA